MIRAGVLALVLCGLAGSGVAQALETALRPVARGGDAAAIVVQGPDLRPPLRPFFVALTGARATGQTLALPQSEAQLPLPIVVADTAVPPRAPRYPGLGPEGIAPGPLAVLAPVPDPGPVLAAHEARIGARPQVSVDVARLGRLFAATRAPQVRIARPDVVVVPDETMISRTMEQVITQMTAQPMPRPDLRPAPRPGSVAAAQPAATEGGQTGPARPGTRLQARPVLPARAQVVPLSGDAVPGPYAAFAPPVVALAATPVALRPPERPAQITRAYQAARAERVRGQVCGTPDIQGQAIAPVGSGGCRVSNPVRITSVGGVGLSRPSVMDCDTARALNAWVERGARPAVGSTGGGIASLRVIGAYSCRTRNNVPGARLSEHAKGRAVDIAGIRLRDGSEISVLRNWNSGRGGEALRAMHRSACGIFGTVLGPNANAAHRDHFHFDTATYRTGSYCR